MVQQSNSTLYYKKFLFHTAATSFNLNVGHHEASYKKTCTGILQRNCGCLRSC